MSELKSAGLYVAELLAELQYKSDDLVSLRHPMAFGEVSGLQNVLQLCDAAAAVFEKISPQQHWHGAELCGREWHGQFQGRQIRGVSVVRRGALGLQVEIYLGSFPLALRLAMKASSGNLIASQNWSLPAGIDTSLAPFSADEVLNAKLQFGLANDAMLTSPVACKPIRGAGDVERVCGHSIQVYGGRASGPRLTEGALTLSLWTGEVAGLALEVANVIHWQDPQHVRVMAMAMRPWPVVEIFKARMQARTLSFLDASYFEIEAQANELQFAEV